jgi:hypothetical protein
MFFIIISYVKTNRIPKQPWSFFLGKSRRRDPDKKLKFSEEPEDPNKSKEPKKALAKDARLGPVEPKQFVPTDIKSGKVRPSFYFYALPLQKSTVVTQILCNSGRQICS